MAFCANCGANVPDGTSYCLNCGQPIAAEQPAPEQNQNYNQGYQQQQQQYNGGYQQQYYGQQQYYQQPDPYQQYVPDYSPESQQPKIYANAAEDIAENKALSFLCYLEVLMIIPLIAKPTSQYIKFHANQGLVLMIFTWLCAIVCIIPILGWIVGGIGEIFAFVCLIIGLVNSLGGKFKPLPLIGKYKILK